MSLKSTDVNGRKTTKNCPVASESVEPEVNQTESKKTK